jgi:hypothetical protein
MGVIRFAQKLSEDETGTEGRKTGKLAVQFCPSHQEASLRPKFTSVCIPSAVVVNDPPQFSGEVAGEELLQGDPRLGD